MPSARRLGAMLIVALLPVLVLNLAPARAAELTPHIEAVAGAELPVGGDDYTEHVSGGPKLGLRAVGLFERARPWAVGVELAADVARLEWLDNFDLDRWRGLAGARLVYRATPRLQLFARGLAGIDHRSGGLQFQAPGEHVGLSTLRLDATALALELGIGAKLTLGRFVLGAQLGLPVAFYGSRASHDRGSVLSGGVSQPVSETALARVLVETTSYDLDVLVTLGVELF